MIASTLFSQQFPILGARAKAMGGAYVAVADDATSVYWNPAGIVLRRLIDINFTYDAKTGQTSDVLGSMDEINSLNLVENPQSIDAFSSILQEINIQNPFIFGGNQWGASYTNDMFGAAYMESSILTATPNIDLIRIDPSAASPNFYMNNESSLDMRRIKFTEYIFSGGYLLWSNDSFIGASVKYVNTSTSFESRNLLSGIESGYNQIDFALDSLTGDAFEDSFISFDVGTIFYLGTDLRVGVVGKNILSPTFEVAEGQSLEMKAQWRAGFLFHLGRSIIIAGDYDILKNSYFSEGPEFQEAALGMEAALFENRLFIRAGVSSNMTGEYKPLILSGGLGIAISDIVINAAVQYAPEAEILSAGVQIRLSYRSYM